MLHQIFTLFATARHKHTYTEFTKNNLVNLQDVCVTTSGKNVENFHQPNPSTTQQPSVSSRHK